MSTIHNPVNFEPTDYVVVDYIDNQPPPCWTSNIPAWQEAVTKWREHIVSLKVQGGIHRCCHCGNGTIRYVTVCLHKPSGRNVAFGTDCTKRLCFEGASAFKAAYIRTKAANMAAAAAKLARMQVVLDEHPGLAEALARTENGFIADVASKFERYGELSDRQIEAVISAAARDQEFKARREAEKANRGPVPVGKRIEFEGVLTSRKQQDGFYGIVSKCLIKLDNGAAIWMTEPAACDANIGDRVKIRATVEASKDDPGFGFASRPHFLGVIKP